MKSPILTILGILALPGAALADPGHIADSGHGHSHWYLYVLLAGVLFGLGVWARSYLTGR